MSKFFIDRPVFAWVLAILTMLAGVLGITNLPISQYPEIAPPQIEVQAIYPGASAESVEKSVTQIIEREMKGLDGLMYMSANSASNGSATISLTFDNAINPDTAQVQVQNKVQAASSRLPSEVQRQGVRVNKTSSGFLVVLSFSSTDGSMDRTDIADYVDTNVTDILSRVEGVGNIQLFGSPYAMRIWLDPEALRSYSLMPQDIIAAIQAQNAQVSAGQLGALPVDNAQPVINATISVQSRLKTPEQFQKIILKSSSSGSQIRLGDVARVELGAENYEMLSRYNRDEAAGVGVYLASGANALQTRAAVEKTINELKKNFPAGLKVDYPYDTTPFVRLSIESVVATLLEAIVLVFLVMLLFLQNWRATIIPTMAVPVVLLGTFATLYMLGYSINTLTMFAMVLSIGLLVDDAIVVVENVERLIEEEGLDPITATKKSMDEISKAVIGIAVVLSAVFVPMAFMSGSTGVIYRQFSVTLVTSMVLSALVALILTPTLCATLLKTKKHNTHEKKGFFGWFNRVFGKLTNGYQNIVGWSIGKNIRYAAAFAAIIAGLSWLFVTIPSSFLPDEDQGIMFTMIQLPAGATQQDTVKVIKKVEDFYLDTEKDNVKSIYSIAGFSFAGTGQNAGIAFVKLKDWDKRKGEGQDVKSVAGRAMGYFMSQINNAFVFAFAPPSITSLGNATGFNLQLQDRNNLGHEALIQARNQLLGMAAQDKRLVGVRPNGQEDTPEYKLNIDHNQATSMGIAPSITNQALSAAWGSAYVNDFVHRGAIKRVYLQGEPSSRMMPEDISKWYVRNNAGNMVALSSFATGNWTYGSPRLERYNSMPSVNIQGDAAPGVSTGEAMQAMEAIIAKLPKGIGFEWTGLSLEEKKSGSQAPMLYAITILIVFLALAVLYESWSIPFAIMLVVPMGVLGALGFTFMRGLANDIYLQVGLLTIIGLSAKNAILIVEFAEERMKMGYNLYDSVVVAAKQRFRPIIMTSMAFGLGVVPLFLASGAGSGSQNAVGTSVLGGIISATVLGVFFIPMFYVWVMSVFRRSEIKVNANNTIASVEAKLAANASSHYQSHADVKQQAVQEEVLSETQPQEQTSVNVENAAVEDVAVEEKVFEDTDLSEPATDVAVKTHTDVNDTTHNENNKGDA